MTRTLVILVALAKIERLHPATQRVPSYNYVGLIPVVFG